MGLHFADGAEWWKPIRHHWAATRRHRQSTGVPSTGTPLKSVILRYIIVYDCYQM